MSNKKIAFYSYHMKGGGADRISLILATGFAERGYSVDLVLNSAEGHYMQYIPSNIRIIEIKHLKLWKRMIYLAQYIKKEKPFAIHCAEKSLGFLPAIAKIILISNLRIIVEVANTHSIRNIYSSKPTIKERVVGIIQNFLLPRVAKLVAVSQGVMDDQVMNFRVPSNRIVLIYNPVVTKQLKRDMNKPVDHKWLLEKEMPVVLAAGRLQIQKDFVTLLHAFKKVVARIEARLIIIGEGEQRTMLELLVQELDLDSWVDMPGFADNPYAYMQNSDLFVLSSRFEGFGNVVVEAMACGCPVVSTNCPFGPSEILNNGEYGTLVPVGDSEALGQAIIESLQQEHDISKLQARAEEFSDDKIIDEYLELFNTT